MEGIIPSISLLFARPQVARLALMNWRLKQGLPNPLAALGKGSFASLPNGTTLLAERASSHKPFHHKD
jgi:hypothetical protein